MENLEFRSNHPGDVYYWIIKVFKSCKTATQIRNAKKLIWNYEKIYKNSMTDLLLVKYNLYENNILNS